MATETLPVSHTLGPWGVQRLGLDATSVFPSDRSSNDGSAIAQAFGADRQANARLIAAAPKLLAAARLALDALRNLDPGDQKHETGWASDEGCQAYCALFDAITEAAGKPE